MPAVRFEAPFVNEASSKKSGIIFVYIDHG